MKKALVFLIVLWGLFFFTGSFYIVKETEQVVITRFGRPIGDAIVDAGIHFKAPFIDTVNVFEKRILEWDGYTSQISTAEKKFIIVDTTARWKIKNALVFLQSVGKHEADAQTRLDGIIDSAVRNEVRSNKLIEIVRNSNRVIDVVKKEGEVSGETFLDESAVEEIFVGREQITRNILKRAAATVENLGIQLIDVRIKGLMYEASVLEKVFDRMISERKKIAVEIRSEGQAEKAKIEGQKNLELKKIQSKAYRRAQEIKGEADAESTKIYAKAYDLEPEFYQFLKSLESYEKSLKENSSLILGTNIEFLKVLKSGE